MTNTPSHTAEIVTFRVAENTTRDDFLAAARATDAIVRAAPGFISRQLSCDSDGLWTDYILWHDLDAAKSAAETVTKHPSFAPFGQAINMASVTMRHAEIAWQM